MTRPTLKPLAAAIFLASLYGNAVADTFEAADEAGLRDAIHQVNSLPGTHFIVLTNNITLTDALPPVLNNVTVQGNNFTLTGSGDQRLLLIGAGQEGSGPRILVHLNNLTLGQGVAAGGDGADGGGGGAGLGGEFGVGVEVSRPLLLARERWAQLQAGVGLSQPWGDTAPVQRAWFTGTTESFSVSAARHDGVILDYGLGASFHASVGSAFWVGYQGRASDLLSEGHALLGMQVRW